MYELAIERGFTEIIGKGSSTSFGGVNSQSGERVGTR